MTIAAWLTVGDATAAVDFYTRALGAETISVMSVEGVVQVARMGLSGSTFWVQHDDDITSGATACPAVRMIVTVEEPEVAIARALSAGASEVAPVHEEHGWRTGRLADPFGHEWELAREV